MRSVPGSEVDKIRKHSITEKSTHGQPWFISFCNLQSANISPGENFHHGHWATVNKFKYFLKLKSKGKI